MPSRSGNSASSAGTCNPAWAIKASNPTVLRATVFPPALGPVIIITLAGRGSTTPGEATSSPLASLPAVIPESFSPNVRLMGTGFAEIKGWRARISLIRLPEELSSKPSGEPSSKPSGEPSRDILGDMARQSREQRPLAIARSRRPSRSSVNWRSGPNSPTSADRSRRILSSSRSSASRVSRQWFPNSMAAIGSIKTVAPLSDTSCTMPGA